MYPSNGLSAPLYGEESGHISLEGIKKHPKLLHVAYNPLYGLCRTLAAQGRYEEAKAFESRWMEIMRHLPGLVADCATLRFI